MPSVFYNQVEGLDVIGLRSDEAEVAVLPALGSKVCSLVDRRTGREWMWAAPEGPRFARVPTASAFDEGCLLGADECIPTVAACTWAGLQMADHGEAWTEAWSVDRKALLKGSIVTTLKLPISPLEMQRAITLEGRTVRFAYELRSLSDAPFQYLWTFHPMMNIQEGDRLELPEEVRQVRVDSAFGCTLGERGDVLDWPRAAEDVDLSALDLGRAGGAVKVYTEPLKVGRAAAVNEATGDGLAFEFDTDLVNTIGLWINRGGWGGYHHFAIEPTNGAPDPLDMAAGDWNRCGELQPGQVHSWSFTITVGK